MNSKQIFTTRFPFEAILLCSFLLMSSISKQIFIGFFLLLNAYVLGWIILKVNACCCYRALGAKLTVLDKHQRLGAGFKNRSSWGHLLERGTIPTLTYPYLTQKKKHSSVPWYHFYSSKLDIFSASTGTHHFPSLKLQSK